MFILFIYFWSFLKLEIDSSHLPQLFCPGTARRHSNTCVSPMAQDSECHFAEDICDEKIYYLVVSQKQNKSG